MFHQLYFYAVLESLEIGDNHFLMLLSISYLSHYFAMAAYKFSHLKSLKTLEKWSVYAIICSGIGIGLIYGCKFWFS